MKVQVKVKTFTVKPDWLYSDASAVATADGRFYFTDCPGYDVRRAFFAGGPSIWSWVRCKSWKEACNRARSEVDRQAGLRRAEVEGWQGDAMGPLQQLG